jgi:hypothetical protein
MYSGYHEYHVPEWKSIYELLYSQNNESHNLIHLVKTLVGIPCMQVTAEWGNFFYGFQML